MYFERAYASMDALTLGSTHSSVSGPSRMPTMMPITAFLLLALALGAGPSAPSAHSRSAAVQDADAESFQRTLTEAQQALTRRRWAAAEKSLRELLRQHAGADYVRPHLQGVREDLRRAAFWKGVDEPDPKSLISGKLLRYTTSGSIRVRYASGTLGDFEHEENGYFHPMHFSSSWTIEVEGTPEAVTKAAYFVALTPVDGYLMRFGERQKGNFLYSRHFAQRVQASGTTELGFKEPKERDPARKKLVKAKISVNKREIRMTYEGKKVLELEKSEEGYGSLGLILSTSDGSDGSFGEVTISGTIDPGWIGGLIDKALATQRKEFDAAWVEPQEFAAWEIEEIDVTADLTWKELLDRLKFKFRFEQPEQAEFFAKIEEALHGSTEPALATSILKQMEDWPESALPEAARAYVQLNCAMLLDRPSLALLQIDKLEVSPEQSLDRDLLRAYLNQSAGRLEAALSAFEAIAQANSTASLAYVGAAQALLRLGRADEAHRVLLRGLAKLPSSPSLRDLEAQVVKASKGPPWERTTEDRGDYFMIRTDGGRKFGRDARRVLDEAWEHCEEFFGALPPGAIEPQLDEKGDVLPHSVAYLFSGEASYLDYVNGIADETKESTLGIYSPLLKQIVAWNQPSTDQLFDTLRHEVAHRYLDLCYGERTPRWLNEGLAECFAASWNANGEFEPPGLRTESLLAAPSVELTSIDAFMTQDEEAFLSNAQAGYIQAWALVHFLRFGADRDRSIHDAILEGLAERSDLQLAIEEALDGVDVQDLQDRFLAWLNERIREAHGR